MVAAGAPLAAAPPSPPPPAAVLTELLAAYRHAIDGLHARVPRTLETSGALDGLGLKGTFHRWRSGRDERYDEVLGVRTERTLRKDGIEYVQNADGDVRALHGIAQRRQITEDFIDSGAFARHPEDDRLIGPGKLFDGRRVWRIRVQPPGGETFGVALDAGTFLVDEKAYPDGDTIDTMDYSDYRVVDGALIAFREVDSSGNHAYDVTSRVLHVHVDAPIDPAVFAPLVSTTIDAPAPVTVPLLDDKRHFFVRASVDGHSMIFLLDTGAQGIFLDPAAASRLGLKTQGMLEVRGVRRTNGLGVAALDAISIGTATLPVRVVSVVGLNSVTYGGVGIDGVLGYPFFAAAEVRIDPDRDTMIVAKPGTIEPLGSAVPIDTDREFAEAQARIDNVPVRLLVDTGNSNELLVFHRFVLAHPGAVFSAGARRFANNRGVGGSSAAVPAMVNELDLGPFRLYNRYADVMLSDTGAFADSEDAGNVGAATLRSFVFTFDFAHRLMYLEPTRWFDDGRFRGGPP